MRTVDFESLSHRDRARHIALSIFRANFAPQYGIDHHQVRLYFYYLDECLFLDLLIVRQMNGAKGISGIFCHRPTLWQWIYIVFETRHRKPCITKRVHCGLGMRHRLGPLSSSLMLTRSSLLVTNRAIFTHYFPRLFLRISLQIVPTKTRLWFFPCHQLTQPWFVSYKPWGDYITHSTDVLWIVLGDSAWE